MSDETTPTDGTTRRFTDALHTLESSGDTGPMAELFTSDATVQSIDGLPDRTGPDGVSALFTTYLEQFRRISTDFTVVTEGAASSTLEWVSEATAADGRELSYRGVTIIDVAGGAITGFRTVYDSAALLQRPTDG